MGSGGVRGGSPPRCAHPRGAADGREPLPKGGVDRPGLSLKPHLRGRPGGGRSDASQMRPAGLSRNSSPRHRSGPRRRPGVRSPPARVGRLHPGPRQASRAARPGGRLGHRAQGEHAKSWEVVRRVLAAPRQRSGTVGEPGAEVACPRPVSRSAAAARRRPGPPRARSAARRTGARPRARRSPPRPRRAARTPRGRPHAE